MYPFQVLIVDDSAFMRKIITDLISGDPHFKVVGTAKNGKEAVEKACQLKPDVITMDVEMPEMNGLEALQRIMIACPTPVIMLSSLTFEGAAETLRALEIGAIDFVQKPSGSISLDLHKVREQLLDKLRIAVRARLAPLSSSERTVRVPARPQPEVQQKPMHRFPPTTKGAFEHLVAIGTSTGGPRALQLVLSHIPANFPAPILVVQHMPPKFTKSLADRLDSLCAISVVEAEDDMRVEPATAYIAPGGYHMTLTDSSGYRLKLHQDDPRGGHRPSVDVLFESLVAYRNLKRHIVLMTGMGSDGARGMRSLKDAGAVTTIAESEQTCVVYGMPRSAVELQGADTIVPNFEIADQLVRAVQ